MNPKRLAFVNAYLGDANGNGTKAAIAAGYSEHTASVQASQLLRHPEVKAELERRLKKHDLRTDAILARLAKIVYAEPDKLTGADVNTAARTILQVNGALKDSKGDARVTVNIGFLSPTAPQIAIAATAVTDDDTSHNLALEPTVVMSQRPQSIDSGD